MGRQASRERDMEREREGDRRGREQRWVAGSAAWVLWDSAAKKHIEPMKNAYLSLTEK